MHRTPLYIDKSLMQVLATLGKQRGLTISELVSCALKKTYGRQLREGIVGAALASSRDTWENSHPTENIQKHTRIFRADSICGLHQEHSA